MASHLSPPVVPCPSRHDLVSSAQVWLCCGGFWVPLGREGSPQDLICTWAGAQSPPALLPSFAELAAAEPAFLAW